MTKTKEQRVHEVFEKISGNYDKMNSVISFQQHKKWREDTMSRMNVQKGSTTLDVCCGTADWTISMGQAVGPEGKAIGLDFSQNMLNVGYDKVKAFPQIELIHGNAMELPYPDSTFDYITIGFGLRNVPDYMQVLKEINRVLKAGRDVCLFRNITI
jgi:demethylmenaquinone methyltransferase/2-methoxy-6-polyprenyl-1,4-benzoquinol methylase